MDQTVVTALIAGPVGAIAVLLVTRALNWRGDRAFADKTEAEADSIVIAGYERYAVSLEERLGRLEERVTSLEKALHASEAQVRGLNRLLRSTVRWALTLRDELIRLGGTVPDMPSEVELALTTLDSATE